MRSWVALALFAFACSSDRGALTEASDPDPESLTGTVTRIDDKVSVDGPVILELRLDTGETVIAYLPSFFLPSPTPPEQAQIYQVIRELDVGARIRVEGQRNAFGLLIRKLTVLGE